MSRRTERIAEAIRRISSEILQSELRDPRTDGFITITKVEVTPDLRFAKIFYSVLGNEKKKKLVAAGLKSARSFVKKKIANELKLRYATDIAFKVDERAEYRERIDMVLNKIHDEEENERDKGNSKSDKKE